MKNPGIPVIAPKKRKRIICPKKRVLLKPPKKRKVSWGRSLKTL